MQLTTFYAFEIDTQNFYDFTSRLFNTKTSYDFPAWVEAFKLKIQGNKMLIIGKYYFLPMILHKHNLLNILLTWKSS